MAHETKGCETLGIPDRLLCSISWGLSGPSASPYQAGLIKKTPIEMCELKCEKIQQMELNGNLWIFY